MAKRTTARTKSSEGEDVDAGAPRLHPRFTQMLLGHTDAGQTFLRAYNSGALHHAWLLTGEQGIGKATFAYQAARFLLSRNASVQDQADTLFVHADDPAGRQITAGAHSSLFVLDNTLAAAASSSIGVDEVRKLRSFLGLTSPGGWRAMIVDPANNLTIASANALLKAVEEPPPRMSSFSSAMGRRP